jgi:two-component system C4-dicarboxylate transport sensor histidine kinase DctB
MSDAPANSVDAPIRDVKVRAADRELGLADLLYLNRMTTVGQVLPNVAHELNNALQIISGIVEILTIRDALPDDVREKLGRIGFQTGRATEMIRELVAFARREHPGPAIADVVRIIERALALRRYHLARARITVTVEGVPAGQALVRLDADYLQQILLNLIINAEHSVAGRADGRIGLTVTRRRHAIEVTVADNGGGVPDGLADRVREPFFTTKPPAAGLGLTVAERLVAQLGGSLALAPADGGGVVATLALPAEEAAGAPVPAGPRPVS